jgi:peptide deformylase
MSLLSILKFPDPRLKKVAAPVTVFDAALKSLVKDMAETMYEAPGVGLAATQVDVHKQVVVIDTSDEKNQLLVLINPIISARDGDQVYEEGCLSVPGIYEKIDRAERVVVSYQDVDGKSCSLEATGLLAVCIQHELDHLQGKVFLDHLSQLKQTRIKAKMLKQARETL